MAVPSSASVTEPRPDALGGRSARWAPWLPIACVLLGCGPLIYAQCVNLLAKPHYQFIVLVPLGAALLWRRDLAGLAHPVNPLHWLSTLVCLTALAGAGLATWVWSPWLGMASALLAAWPCLWWFGGWPAWMSGWRGWLMACSMLNLPFGVDEDLTVRLRSVATRWTSSALDEFGILHLSYGNVIELPTKILFVADACSGVYSLFVLLTAALFVAMWLERSLLHTVLLLATATGIVLLENVARLASVALGLSWRMDLSEGLSHYLLGAALFGVSLGLLLSADQLLYGLLPARPWRTFRSFFSRPDNSAPRPRSPAAAASSQQWIAVLVLSAAFPVLGVAGAIRMPRISLLDLAAPDLRLPSLGAEALPHELAGFEFRRFETVRRIPGDPLGRDSQQWTFESGSLSAMVSLDYPYEGVHDLTPCYELTGWTVEGAQRWSADDVLARLGDGRGPLAWSRMHRSLYGHALLVFSLADRNGKIDAVVKSLVRGEIDDRASRRLQSWRAPATPGGPPVVTRAPFVQFQLLVRSKQPLSDAEVSRLLGFYVAVRGLLADQVHKQIAPTAAADPAAPLQP